MFNPQSLDEIIGLEKIKERIQIAVSVAKEKDEPVRHILLYGPPGTGKTTLGNIIAKMMGSNIHYSVGNQFDVARAIRMLNSKDILFIDEIHMLKGEEEEKLYLPMTDFHFVNNKGLYNTPILMAPFTLIGATTLMGKVSKPLIDRFPLQFPLHLYSLDEMAQIVEQAANKDGVRITKEAIYMIAQAGRDTPRVALALLTNITDFLLYRNKFEINPEMVQAMFELIGVQEDGLTEQDREYLALLLTANRALGVNAIAASLMTDANTIRNFVEPFLLRKKYIAITGQGRMLLAKGEIIARGEVDGTAY